jgi:hypothetical protein
MRNQVNLGAPIGLPTSLLQLVHGRELLLVLLSPERQAEALGHQHRPHQQRVTRRAVLSRDAPERSLPGVDIISGGGDPLVVSFEKGHDAGGRVTWRSLSPKFLQKRQESMRRVVSPWQSRGTSRESAPSSPPGVPTADRPMLYL